MDVEAAKMIGAGIATLGVIGPGIGLGILFANWFQAVARNPEASGKIDVKGFIGMALTEAVALFAILIAILILFS